MPRITPNLWFDTEGLEAAEFYVSVFPNSKITNVLHYGEAGPREAGMVLTVDFVLDGQEFTVINGGPEFKFDAFMVSPYLRADYMSARLGTYAEQGPTVQALTFATRVAGRAGAFIAGVGAPC